MKPNFLAFVARAFAGVLGELGIGPGQRDGRRLRLLLRCATSKKPSVKAGLVSGPVGSIEKYFGYLNLLFTASPNRLMKIFFLEITTGIAGAIMAVA